MKKQTKIFSNKKSFETVSLVLNLSISFLTFFIAYLVLRYGIGDGQLGGEIMQGFGYFKAFTVDSNVFCGIVSLLVAIFDLRSLLRNRSSYPHWLRVLQLSAAASVMLTLVTVLFLLGPIRLMNGKNFWELYSGSLFFYHLLLPLMALIAFVFFCPEKITFKKSDYLVAMFPMLTYMIVYIVNVLLTKIWPDFYNFTFGGNLFIVPVVVVVAIIVQFSIIYFLTKYESKTRNPKIK